MEKSVTAQGNTLFHRFTPYSKIYFPGPGAGLATFPYICNIVEITALTRVASYKHWIAAAFLLLYLFIATPVHWWHRHQQINTSTRSTTPVKQNQDTEKAFAKATYAANCTICSHHYSVYAVTATWSPEALPALFSQCQANYQESNGTIPALLLSNKGPPAVACRSSLH